MKNTGRPKTPTTRSLRESELSSRNVGRDLSATPDRGSTAKSTFLQQHATRTPTDSPMARLASVAPKDLVAKVDAPNAGDHSPSVSALNKTPDKVHGISGRSSYSGAYGTTTREQDVPTLQFNTRDFDTRGVRDPSKGSAAHTMYTSLREMHGVGESHNVSNFSDMLDKTREAYSSYNAKGEPNRGGIQPYRVNVHSESASGPELHRSKQGVEPMVAQSMINLHYRDPGFLKREVPDVVRRSHQQHAEEQRRQTSAGPRTVEAEPSPSQRGVEGVRAAVSSMSKKRPREETHVPSTRPIKK